MFQYIGEYKDGLNKAYTGTVDINDNIYISDTSNNRIVKLNSTMEYVSQYTGLKSPRGITTDNNGNIYIADSANHRVVKLNSSMEYISQFGTTGVIKTDNTGLNIPCGLDIDINGNIYIIEYGNERLIKLNSNMEYVSQFTELYGPYDVCIDNNGNIYIADMRNDRVVKLNSNMEYVSQFGFTDSSRSDHTGLYGPSGVCIDSNGNIFISDIYNNRIVKLNSNMEYVSQYRDGIANPQGIFVDNNDNIYIADYNNNRILIIKHIAQYEKQFGITGTYKQDNTGLYNPSGITVDNDGNIYISDNTNHRIVKLNSNMEYISQFGITGTYKTDNTGLYHPNEILIDTNKNIYVVSYYDNRIVKLNSNMEYVSQHNTGLYHPLGIGTDSNGNIYVTDSGNHRIIKYNSNMEYISQFGTTGVVKSDNTGLNNPYYISLDSYDNIYIADYTNNRIVKLNGNMEYVSQYNTGLKTPRGVSIDNNDNIYISDSGNHRIIKLDSNMNYISQFGTTAITKTDNTGLNTPSDVSIDNNGNIYISDTGNHRVVKLTNLLFQILCNLIQYINTPLLLDINISEQVDTLRVLLNEQEKVLLNNVSSYKYNLDKIWNELLLENNVVIETNKGNKSLSIYKPILPETKMYTNTIKDVLFEYSINPSYDNTNVPLSFIYSVSLDGKILYSQDTPQTDSVTSSISISYNDLVISNYKNITDRNLMIQKTNVDSGELINYNIPIRIDPKRLFSKYFNGVNNYIIIKDWVKPLSELTIQVVKKSLTDSDFTVSIDNSLVSLIGSELKIGGVSAFIGNIYEIRVWEKGKEQPYTYDQLYGNEEGLYALYRLNEYNSTNVYNSCKSILHGKYTGELSNQEIIPTDSNYLTKVNINNELNDIVKQKEDYEYNYSIENKSIIYRNINTNNEQEILLSLNNLSILQNLFIKRESVFDINFKVGDILLQPEKGWKRIDDSDINIKYTEFPAGTNSSCYNNTYHQTIEYGSKNKVEFKFYGSRIRLIGLQHPAYSSNIAIVIDNNEYIFSSQKPQQYQSILYEKINLFKGNHIVSIFTKDVTQLGYVLDAIDINEDGYLIPIT